MPLLTWIMKHSEYPSHIFWPQYTNLVIFPFIVLIRSYASWFIEKWKSYCFLSLVLPSVKCVWHFYIDMFFTTIHSQVKFKFWLLFLMWFRSCAPYLTNCDFYVLISVFFCQRVWFFAVFLTTMCRKGLNWAIIPFMELCPFVNWQLIIKSS